MLFIYDIHTKIPFDSHGLESTDVFANFRTIFTQRKQWVPLLLPQGIPNTHSIILEKKKTDYDNQESQKCE